MDEGKISDDPVFQSNKYLGDALGAFIINYAYFNSSLDGVVSNFLGLTIEQARALVVPLQPRDKINLIRGYSKNILRKKSKKRLKKSVKNAAT